MTIADDLRQELHVLDKGGLRRRLRQVTGRSGREVSLDHRAVINFSSNNYLGLADHPLLVQAAIAVLHDAGVGATASRLIAGNHEIHEAFERELATYHENPAARLFNSGYHANLGALQALARPGDAIFSDELNHASIIDGCRLSRAQVVIFPHSDLDALRGMMRERGGARRLVVTDSVFSMDGDRARLAELAELCESEGAALMVDEAHAVGSLGPRGRGMAAEQGVQPDVVMGTLGKSFGSFGAYVTGSAELTEVLLNGARSFVFTTGLPPSIAAAGRAALELIQGAEGEHRRQQLVAHVRRFRDGLQDIGLLARGAGSTPIFPVVAGDDARAMACCERLLEWGIYAQGIRPPTVPSGTARLRFALMATHTEDDIARALDGLRKLVDDGWLPRQGSQHP